MEPINPVSGAASPQPTQQTPPQPPWENKIFAGYLAVIMLLEGVMDGVYIPALKDASLMNQGAQAFFEFLSQNKTSYMGNIDKYLTDFLNGWNYFQKLEKTDPSALPPDIAKLLKNPVFVKLANSLTQMAQIEKNDPNYKNNPKWKALEQSVIGQGGSLDQIQAMGTADPGLVQNVQMFLEMTGINQQTLYQMSSVELKKWNSIVQMTSTFLKRVMSVSQYLTSSILR